MHFLSKTLPLLLLIPATAIAQIIGPGKILESDMAIHFYVAGVDGPAHCTVPSDPFAQMPEGCSVSALTYEAGWRIVQIENRCFRQESKLDRILKIPEFGRVYDVPDVSETIFEVNCKNYEQIAKK